MLVLFNITIESFNHGYPVVEWLWALQYPYCYQINMQARNILIKLK